MGLSLVGLVFRVTGSHANVMGRLGDVDPNAGQRVLITRGEYKYHGFGGVAVTSFALMGAAWGVAAGHVLQLEVAQTDTPLFAPDTLPSTG
jgi:hypothetical protein